MNCKDELKIRLTKENGVENDDAGSNNITFTIKHTKLYVFIVTLVTKDNRKLSKHLSIEFEI